MLSAPDFCRSSLMKTDTVGPLAHTTRFSDVHSISRSPDVFRVMTDRTGTSNSSHQGSSHTRSASGPGLDKLHSWFASVINVSISDGANVRNRAVVAERFFHRSVNYGRLLHSNRTVRSPPKPVLHPAHPATPGQGSFPSSAHHPSSHEDFQRVHENVAMCRKYAKLSAADPIFGPCAWGAAAAPRRTGGGPVHSPAACAAGHPRSGRGGP